MAARTTRLASGARVVSETLPGADSAALGVWFPTGSRHETAATNGISHFVEHLVFKGTATRSADEVNREIDRLGGASNAFTGKERLCFHTRVLGEHLARAVSLFGDLAAHALPPGVDAEVEREREVILSEIAANDDAPEDLLADVADRAFFGEHPLGLPVVGSARAVARLALPAIRAHVAEHLVARELVIAAAGRLEHDALVALVERHFAAVPAGAGLRAQPVPAPAPTTRVIERDLEQVHVCLTAPCVPRGDPRYPAAELWSSILGDGYSSRLFREVRDRRGLAYSVGSSLEAYTDAGCLHVVFAVDAARLDQALEVVSRELRAPLREDELAAAKEQVCTGVRLGQEGSGARMTFLAEQALLGDDAPDVDGVIAALESVTLPSVESLAAELSGARLALAVVGPVESKRFPSGGWELPK
jgi:predicted Zn-dependent peptidase